MFELISLGVGAAAAAVSAVVGYTQTRGFVRRKLAFVDAVQKTPVPFLAGIGAAVVAMPVVALIPFVGGGTVLAFGVAVGAGVSSGVKDIRERRFLAR
jgi:hypothetical protein